jgi:hypothetical protein
MKKRITLLFIQFLLLFAFSSAVSAQNYLPPRVFSQQQLDQMLAPIALYPDSLLSQMLMAATYPIEVQQAADWSRVNPGWQGEQAVQAVQGFVWDPSVKSLVAFPQILAVMASRMDWTANLGDAFLGQQQQVMDTIQYLRRRAIAAGTLRSDSRIHVTDNGRVVMIEPVTVQMVYVPYYNPVYAYGSWWWPNYSPMYWDPWPGYASPYGYRQGLAWGAGVPIGVGLFFGYFDWGHRHVYVRPHRRWQDWNQYDSKRRHEWRHDPRHRHDTPYRSEVVRQRYARPDQYQQDRNSFRGRVPGAAATPPSIRGHVPSTSAARTLTAPDKARTVSTSTVGASRAMPINRMAAPSGQVRAPAAVTRPPRTEQRPTAFEGLEKGRDVRSFSERGRVSAREAGRDAARNEERNGSKNGRGVMHSREQRPSSPPGHREGPPRGSRD